MGGGLILLEILKIVVYAVDPNKFIPDILPFHYSDYVIFVLAAFAFSKKNTTINRLSFINFMALGGITLISMLVAPTYIVVFKDLYENFVYKTIHGFITHYFIFYSFLWLIIWRIIKLEYKDILQCLFSAVTFAIMTMSFAFIFKANYNYCLASPFSGAPDNYHKDWSYIQFDYAFLIWLPLAIIILVVTFTLVLLVNNKLIYRERHQTILK